MKLNVMHPTIEEVFKDFYAVPAFQREYVWQDDQVRTLLEDAFEALFDENGSPIETEYFIGSIVAYKENDVFQLIDGQQRITTLYIVLCAIRDALQGLADGAEQSHLQGLIRDTYQDDLGRTQQRFRLVPLYEDAGQVLQQIGMGEFAHAAEEKKPPTSARNMLDTYRVTREFLEQFSGDAQRIRLFQARLTKKVRLVRIETSNVSEALRIFETINDRGIGLNAMDLLKNLLFMRAPKAQYAALTDTWRQMVRVVEDAREKPLRFLRYLVLSRYPDARKNGKPLTEADLYEWMDDNQEKLGIVADPLVFARGLLLAAEEYRYFVLQPNRHLAHITRLSGRARQHLILMLASKQLDEGQVEHLSERVEALFVAFLLAKEPTKALDLIFSNAAPRLREIVVTMPAEAFDGFLASWIEPEIAKRAAKALEAIGTLGLERKTMVRFILSRLAQYADKQASGVSKSLQSYWEHEIEHVLPNTPTADILAAFDQPETYHEHKQRLGNLLLLEKAINVVVGQDFLEKKSVEYLKSNLLMTRAFVRSQSVGLNTAFSRIAGCFTAYPNERFPDWNSLAIRARQGELTRLVGVVFGYLGIESISAVGS